MATDDLTSPLGLRPPPKPRQRARLAVVAAVVTAVVSVGGLARTFLPLKDAASAAKTEPAPKKPTVIAGGTPAPAKDSAASAAAPPKPAADTPFNPITTRVGTAKIIEVPPDAPSVPNSSDAVISDLQPAGLLSASAEAGLTERTSKGLILPKVGPDGRKPMEAYARPIGALPANTPIVAIVVGGLGISRDSTSAALAALPAPVSLAFAPYGDSLTTDVADARKRGHELLLQIPEEPFDYPNNDPGPQTLLAGASQSENLGRLQWLMSRFGTYVGVVNHMGARFSSDQAALTPVMADVGKRGLLYLDDGSSARSRAKDAAATTQTPFLAADVVLDTVQQASVIDQQLAGLETLARSRGRAIGVASAFPLSVERIALWAKSLQSRGVILVPLTAMAVPVKS